MTKSETSQGGSPASSADPIEMTLDEFCARSSDRKVDGRIALIHGFAYTERKAGHVKDTEANFKKRFVAYATKPV